MVSRLLSALIVAISVPAVGQSVPPTDGLQAWFKAGTGVVAGATGNIGEWTDQSGNGNHATQQDKSLQPILSSAAMPIGQSMAVIRYHDNDADGAYDRLDLPKIAQGSSGATVYLVVNDDADTGADKNWLCRNAGSPPYPPALYGRPATAENAAGFYYNSAYQAKAASLVYGWKLVRFMWSAAGSSTIVTDFAGNDSAGISRERPSRRSTWTSIGTNLKSPPQYTCASFAEILIYDRALDTNEQKVVENYLGHRYFTTNPVPIDLSTIIQRKDTTSMQGADRNVAMTTDRIWLTADDNRPIVRVLGWNPEGDRQPKRNLLGKPCEVLVQVDGNWKSCAMFPTTVEDVTAIGRTYRVAINDSAQLNWSIETATNDVTFALSGTGLDSLQGIRLVFPFSGGHKTPPQVVPANWEQDGTLQLPASVFIHRHGQILISSPDHPHVDGRYDARAMTINLPTVADGVSFHLTLKPFLLNTPQDLKNRDLWKTARRNWLGGFSPSAVKRPGILANNPESDEGSCSTWFYSDQAFFTPEPAPGVQLMPIVRKTVDYWLTRQMLPTGEIICYWGKMTEFLDANASPLISAWTYVESTGDKEWLAKRIDLMEKAADYLAARDVDGDGMVEAIQSGNYNTIAKNKCERSCSWFDALNCGHKDGYANALIYRAWRCMADLEQQLGRTEKAARYTELADRLKAVYAKVLMNPETGWLAAWKSEDGIMHDYASTVVNGMAIEYGLVEPELGRDILAKLRAKMDEVGFVRFDIGVPMSLIPVLKADYLPGTPCGAPKLDDGTDTLGHYMNGAIFGAHVRPFLVAHYVVGDPEPADKILNAMLEHQTDGDYRPDFTAWDGAPGSGYEGALVEYYAFLQTVLLREPAMRKKLLRPLLIE